MAPLTNKERQAAFRARKKVQPFADKHFGGLHVATVDQFLDAVNIEREALTAVFPDRDFEGLDIKDTSWFDMNIYGEEERLANAFILDKGNEVTLSELHVAIKRRLHEHGYFEGLPDYLEVYDSELMEEARAYVRAEAEKIVDEKIAALTEEQKLQIIFYEENQGRGDDIGLDPRRTQQYALHHLIVEYKKIIGLP